MSTFLSTVFVLIGAAVCVVAQTNTSANTIEYNDPISNGWEHGGKESEFLKNGKLLTDKSKIGEVLNEFHPLQLKGRGTGIVQNSSASSEFSNNTENTSQNNTLLSMKLAFTNKTDMGTEGSGKTFMPVERQGNDTDDSTLNTRIAVANATESISESISKTFVPMEGGGTGIMQNSSVSSSPMEASSINDSFGINKKKKGSVKKVLPTNTDTKASFSGIAIEKSGEELKNLESRVGDSVQRNTTGDVEPDVFSNGKVLGTSKILGKSDVFPGVKSSITSRKGVQPQESLEKMSVPRKGVPLPPVNSSQSVSQDVLEEEVIASQMTPQINSVVPKKGVKSDTIPVFTSKVAPKNGLSSGNGSVVALCKCNCSSLSENVYSDECSCCSPVQSSTKVNNVSLPLQNFRRTKPSVTVDNDADNDSEGKDYSVLILSVVFAVPLIMILFFYVFNRGCEFWKRRHYRRMDFLIDGMYND